MATQQKFYLRDTTTTNTGTMPSNSPTTQVGGVLGTGAEAAGNTTARATSAAAGTANPDTKSVCTAQAASGTTQRLGHRRFVTPPLAARTFTTPDGNWTFSHGGTESNTNHNSGGGEPFRISIYPWRPSTGARVGTGIIAISTTTLTATTETSCTGTGAWSGTQAILDGDILVYDVYTTFNQGMATAYTDSFSYNGTTEASTTTNAAFVNAPAALTLFEGALVPRNSAINHQNPAVLMEGMEQDKRNHLWLPKRKLWRPRIHIPTPAMI